MKQISWLLIFLFSSFFIYCQTGWEGNYSLTYIDSTTLKTSIVKIWVDDGKAGDKDVQKAYKWFFKAFYKGALIWEYTGNGISTSDTINLFVDKYYQTNGKIIEKRVNRKVDKTRPFYIVSKDKNNVDYSIVVMQGPKTNVLGKLKKISE